jgi:hypothetical protein
MMISAKRLKNEPRTTAEIRQDIVDKYRRPRPGTATIRGNQAGAGVHIHLGREERPDADLPANAKLRSTEDRIKARYGTIQVKACQWYRRNDKGTLRVAEEVDCMGEDAQFIVYNSLDQDRLLCGHTIPPNGFFLLPDKCEEHSRLFPIEPTMDGKDQPPIVIRSGQAEQPASNRVDFPGCNVPCQQVGKPESGMEGEVKMVIEGTRWKFIHSMESSGYYPTLKVDTSAHRVDKYYATTSFQSEIPLPYYSSAEYKIQQPAVQFDKVIKGASFIARNCGSNNDRENVVGLLSKFIRVDSLSACLHNADPPNGMSMDDKGALQREYLFHLAFENTCEDDYITEKLWGTLASGTVPVYYGAPNAKDHAPPNSIISWHDFNDTTKLGEHLAEVAVNKTLYESYQAWRSQPLPQSFHQKYDFTNTHSVCRMCRWAFAKKHGFGWNHTSQSMQEVAISRKVCAAPNGLVSHPVRERWFQGLKQLIGADEDGSCDSSVPAEIRVESFKRILWSHDGILDFVIEGTGEDGTFQLELPMNATIVRKSNQHYEAQNAVSRVTILSHGRSEPTIHTGGLISVSVAHKGEMRVRVIVEDLDTFHKGGIAETTHFGRVIAKDFFEPLQFYWVLDPQLTPRPEDLVPRLQFDDVEERESP